MSTSTTSASRLSATRSAAEAPTLPAPMIETFLRMSFLQTAGSGPGLDLRDDGVGELRAAHRDRPLHLAGEIVRDSPRLDRPLDPLDDQIGCLLPSHVLEHHGSGEDERAGIDLVL